MARATGKPKRPKSSKPNSKKPAKKVAAARKPAGKKPAPKKVAARKAPPKKPAAKAKAPAKKAPAKKPLKPVKKVAKPVAKAAPPKPVPKPVVKAAPPPKPAPPVKEVPKKPAKPELTPREIAAIKVQLIAQREEFTREAEEIEEGTFNISQSEMSGEVSFDEEYADAGSATFEREKDFSISNNIRDLLDKVNHALSAIERGKYGLCENCGQPIAKARLLALPYSTMCLKCKQQEERTR